MPHPADDGIFKVNVDTKEKRLLVSFKQLADSLRAAHPEVDGKELFINHTLWNRDDDRIYFFVRGDFDKRDDAMQRALRDSSRRHGLRALSQFIGGHPDWESGHRMIGAQGDDQIIYRHRRPETRPAILGSRKIFPKPGGDVALSPDGNWFVNGHGDKGKNYYTILHRSDGAWVRTPGFDQGGFISGDLRLDPGPLWNRDSTQLLVPGIADDAEKTRQLFVITIHSDAQPSNHPNHEHLSFAHHALLLLACAVLNAAENQSRPNIILIMADDMGFSDIGCYGGEIDTPNINRLADEGLRFTQFYNNAKCTTTRASLLSGMYPRNNGNAIPRDIPTIAETMRAAGYQTGMSGKWHLGNKPPQRPIDRGFDEYYGLMDGAVNFFNPGAARSAVQRAARCARSATTTS